MADKHPPSYWAALASNVAWVNYGGVMYPIYDTATGQPYIPPQGSRWQGVFKQYVKFFGELYMMYAINRFAQGALQLLSNGGGLGYAAPTEPDTVDQMVDALDPLEQEYVELERLRDLDAAIPGDRYAPDLYGGIESSVGAPARDLHFWDNAAPELRDLSRQMFDVFSNNYFGIPSFPPITTVPPSTTVWPGYVDPGLWTLEI